MNAIFKFLNLDFGGTTNFDDCNSSGKSSHTLLNLFLVVLAVGSVLLSAEYFYTFGNSCLLSSASHDNGIVLGDNDLLARSEYSKFGLVEGNAKVFRDELCTGGNSDILHGVTAVVSETR